MMMFPETVGQNWTRSNKSGHNQTKVDTMEKSEHHKNTNAAMLQDTIII